MVENKDVKGLVELKNYLPPAIDKADLFNKISEAKPLKDLADGKPFVILGALSEVVVVAAKQLSDEDEDRDLGQLVDRQRVTVITDRGVYISYSITFASALKRANDVFGDLCYSQKYKLQVKLSGSGGLQKAFYVLTVM